MPGLRARVAPRVARDERPRRLRHGDGVGRAHAPLPRAPRRRAQTSRGAVRLPLGPPRGDRRRRRRAPPLDDAVPRCAPPARLAIDRRVPARSVPGLDVRGGRPPPREAALPRAGRGHRRGALPRDGRVPAAHRCVRRVPRLPRARAREREPRRDRPRGRDRDPAAALRRAAGAPPPPRGRPRGARRRLVPERRVPGGAGARARLPGGPLARVHARGGAPGRLRDVRGRDARRAPYRRRGGRRARAHGAGAAQDAVRGSPRRPPFRRRGSVPRPPRGRDPDQRGEAASIPGAPWGAAFPPSSPGTPGSRTGGATR